MSAEQGDSHRLAALAALASAALLAILGIGIVLSQFPRGLIVLVGLAIAFAAAWYGLTRTGGARLLGSGVAIVALAVTVAVLIADGDHLAQALLIVAGLGLMLAATRSAFRIRAPLDPAADPRHPVLFYNPLSGGGKATSFHLADEARRRGIGPIELSCGTDLDALVGDAVAEGADALAMAGGDGSQAIVAMVAAEQGLPYACIPAGTRNHFALDLGVDRDDVVGAPRRLRRRAASGGSTWPRSTAGCSSTTSRSGSTPRRSSARATGTRSCGPSSTRSPSGRTRKSRGRTCAGSGPEGASTPPAQRSSSPTIAIASGARSVREPGRRSTTGCWG